MCPEYIADSVVLTGAARHVVSKCKCVSLEQQTFHNCAFRKLLETGFCQGKYIGTANKQTTLFITILSFLKCITDIAYKKHTCLSPNFVTKVSASLFTMLIDRHFKFLKKISRFIVFNLRINKNKQEPA